MGDTRWLERHTALEDFADLYEPLLDCLDQMVTSAGWDTKTVTEADGLRNQVTQSKFIVAFDTYLHMFDYTKPLNKKLQSSTIDVVKAYSEIEYVLTKFQSIRDNADNSFATLFTKMTAMSSVSGNNISVPRRCSRQTLRCNVASESEGFYQGSIYSFYFVDFLISELKERFSTLALKAVKALYIIPSNIH